MRQITFELLRHGPAHNQLLSPLTNYLALCGNHAATTVQIPIEHNQILYRLNALSYKQGEESRTFQLKDSADALGKVLEKVPGLLAELNRDTDDPSGAGHRESNAVTHLRLIISASELALLPFELALTPNGFPGAGQSLLLQSQEPICLTREVRRVPERNLRWPSEPRILFASAAPPQLPPVPMEAHRQKLEALLEPWIDESETPDERARWMREHLFVIEKATAYDIAHACAEGNFSHVHILAHGAQYADGYDLRFGLALHDASDPDNEIDIVSGDRLATILRPAQTSNGGALALPIAVTLASCDSANVGSVGGIGASVAHALHSAGIPIVIASQFPLSVAGSIDFVEVLYKSFLWSEDPRIALIDLRRRLHSKFPSMHDWVSVAAYVSLPVDFESRLAEMEIERTKLSVDAAINYADYATKVASNSRKWPGPPHAVPSDETKRKLLEDAGARIERGRARIETLMQRGGRQDPKVCSLLAATEKRCAEVYFSFQAFAESPGAPPPVARPDWLQLLRQARKHYWDAFSLRPEWSWAVVQYLSLDLVLRRRQLSPIEVPERPYDEHTMPEALWTLAHVLAIHDLKTKTDREARWALGNLIELYVIAPLIPALEPEKYHNRAAERARELVDRAGAASFEVYSTRRQMLRYEDWYPEIADITPLLGPLDDVIAALPASAKPPKD